MFVIIQCISVNKVGNMLKIQYSRLALDLRNVVACDYLGRVMSQHISSYFT